MDTAGLARILITIGLVIIGLGLIIRFVGFVPGLGKLPGDIIIKRGNVTFYFPLATSIIVSLLLSLLMALLRR